MSPHWYRKLMEQTAQHYNIPTNIPFGDLDEDSKDIILNGSGSTIINFEFISETGSLYQYNKPWEECLWRDFRKPTLRPPQTEQGRLIACMNDEDCPSCNGEKLNDAARMVTVGAKDSRK